MIEQKQLNEDILRSLVYIISNYYDMQCYSHVSDRMPLIKSAQEDISIYFKKLNELMLLESFCFTAHDDFLAIHSKLMSLTIKKYIPNNILYLKNSNNRYNNYLDYAQKTLDVVNDELAVKADKFKSKKHKQHNNATIDILALIGFVLFIIYMFSIGAK